MPEKQETDRRELEERLIAKAWEDETFKQELISNPKAVIEKEFGTKVPEGVEVQGEHVTFSKSRVIRQDRGVDSLFTTMTPEQQKALTEHIQAIAQILYEDTPKEQLTTLAGIEQVVRNQMQEYVMPHVGVFLSQQSQAQQQDTRAPSKASSVS